MIMAEKAVQAAIQADARTTKQNARLGKKAKIVAETEEAIMDLVESAVAPGGAAYYGKPNITVSFFNRA